MPNICEYVMHVQGKKENVKTLYDWLRSYYDYNEDSEMKCFIEEECEGEEFTTKRIPSNHHIGYRVFECYINNGKIDDYRDNEIVTLSGNCAWSVHTCMFNNLIGTYMGDKTYGREDDLCISIDQASKLLKLKIEIFSLEPGMCFSEHYYIKNGNIIKSEESSFREFYIEYYDPKSEYFEQEYYEELTDEEKQLIQKGIKEGEEYVIKCEWYDQKVSEWDWKYLH